MGKPRQRNHEIPRFLLNRFATRAEGDKRWIWRIGRDGTMLELSTRDVAVSPRFYDARLEGVLQIAEGRFSKILAAVDRGRAPEGFSEELRQLMWTLAVRTRATREQFGSVADEMLSELATWAATAEAGDTLVRDLYTTLDTRAQEATAQLPLEQRELATASLRVPAVREQVIAYARANFGDCIETLVRVIQDRRIVSTSAKTGQIRGLTQLLDRGSAPEQFRPKAWHVVRADRHSFILGDGCVFAKLANGSLASLLKDARNWVEAYLPISDHQVLVATREATGPSLDSASFNEASAALASRYFYTSRVSATVRDLMPQIGAWEPLLSRDELVELVRQDFKPRPPLQPHGSPRGE
jgi:hypothetical protein